MAWPRIVGYRGRAWVMAHNIDNLLLGIAIGFFTGYLILTTI